MTTLTPNAAEQAAWDKVRATLEASHSVAFDGCHKIYVLADAEAGDYQHRVLGYGDGSDGSEYHLVTDADEALATVQQWFEDSCFLRFVSGIRGPGNENANFFRLIDQGEEEEWYPDKDDPYWTRA